MLHKFKMTSTDAFFVFSKFWFSGLLGWREGGKRVQKLSKMTKQICLTLYLRNCTSYDCGFWHTCVKWWYLQHFFFFFSFFHNSDFSGFSKFINKDQKEIMRLAPPSSYMCDFFLYLYPTLSEMPYTILCSMPAGKIARFTPAKFDCRRFIFL